MDDFYIYDCLAHVSGLLLSKFNDSRTNLIKNTNLMKVLESEIDLYNVKNDLIDFTLAMEKLLTQIFNVN